MLPMVPQHWYIQIILKLIRSGRIQDVTIDYGWGLQYPVCDASLFVRLFVLGFTGL